MVVYSVYGAGFLTKKKTKRRYIGYTGQFDGRVDWQKKKLPHFMSCCKPETIEYELLEVNVTSKPVALALEALHAARQIARNPSTTRGGLWTSPRRLSSKDMEEIQSVSRCKSLVKVGEPALAFPKGRLNQHLQDVAFEKPSVVGAVAEVVRGAVVTWRAGKRSGTAGSKCRSRQLKCGKLVAGSRKHVRLHRGRKPTLARRRENAKRPS